MHHPIPVRDGWPASRRISRVVGGAVAVGLIVLAGSAQAGSGRRIPVNAPWLSFYGTAAQMGDLQRVATTFRLINIDADPNSGNFTPAQIRALKAGGRNTVISYLNIGSCERTRSYWSQAPAGLIPCGRNRTGQIGPYRGFPDEVWM